MVAKIYLKLPILGKLPGARWGHPDEGKRFNHLLPMRGGSGFRRFYGGLALCLACFAFSSCSSNREPQPIAQDKTAAAQMVEQADNLYRERADLRKAREGVILLGRALAADTGSYDAAWRLSRFCYFLGAHTGDKAERGRAYDRGVDAGRRAVRLQDGKPEGHFWLGANLGGQAQTSMLSGLAAIDEIRAEMQRVIQLDEGFQGGSAYMALGQVDLEAPSMFGGDTKRAVEVLEKNLRFGENNALYRLRLGQAYLAVNRREDARREFDAVLGMKPDPDYVPEYADASTQARRLLEQIK